MEPKDYLTNRNFCPIPWTGLMYNFDGNVKTCIRSSAPIGNIREQDIEQILNGENNQATRIKMLNKRPVEGFDPCYEVDKGGIRFVIIGDGVFDLLDLKQLPLDPYDKLDGLG